MGYTKSELRSTHKPLLSRIQRRIDMAKEKPIQIPLVKEQCSLSMGFSSFASQELDTTDKLILKDTRLKLYKKRGGR